MLFYLHFGYSCERKTAKGACHPCRYTKVVGNFYARVRGHPLLGPIFFSTISHDPDLWREHEAKIARFWANALLYENQYSGNPMMVHAGISAIKPQHFDIWLGLFEQTLFEVLEQKTAQLWSELAHRIGRGLQLGIEQARQRTGKPPNLR